MPTMGKHALLLSLLLATPLTDAQSGPDRPMRPPPPPDTTLTRQQADQGRDEMVTPLKISYGKKSAEWTAPKLAQFPHETIQAINERTQAQETYSGVPLIALLVELGVPQKLKGKDFRLYVVAEGRDGNKVVYSLGEVSPDVHNGSVLLVDSVDGKPLADNGPIELVCSGERRPARWVRGVISIKVQAAD
ncbi:MAG TPA: hypothetical protein VK574_06025 [Terracidiphilus sp.]|nr:hypothetical protein [Terracidiphilus sp.]